MAEDLRHEVAHGYLHAVVPQLPLWLDEGLAEYFEVPRGMAGVNRPHVDQLVAEMSRGLAIRISSGSSGCATPAEMTQTDYAESWAWVHFLLETTPERRQLLQGYLRSLHASAPTGSFSTLVRQSNPQIERQLIDYVQVLHRSLE